MMTGAIARAWQSVKPHIPMIKFRKGGSGAAAGSSASTAQASLAPAPKKLPPSKAQQLPLIEDWQLPLRYRRSIIEDKEIDAINSGGAY